MLHEIQRTIHNANNIAIVLALCFPAIQESVPLVTSITYLN